MHQRAADGAAHPYQQSAGHGIDELQSQQGVGPEDHQQQGDEVDREVTMLVLMLSGGVALHQVLSGVTVPHMEHRQRPQRCHQRGQAQDAVDVVSETREA